METNQPSERSILRKLTLDEASEFELPVGTGPAERLMMMWQITLDCWSFVPGYDAEQEFQRNVSRVERGGS